MPLPQWLAREIQERSERVQQEIRTRILPTAEKMRNQAIRDAVAEMGVPTPTDEEFGTLDIICRRLTEPLSS